jgi:hypothetical protein
MRTPTTAPTRALRDSCPTRRRGLGAMARQVAVDLTPQAVEQVAARVAALLQRQQQSAETLGTKEQQGFLNVAQLARHLGLNPAWVYEHADELGAIRIGDGPKARIRFDLHTAKEALRQNQASRTPAPGNVKPRKPRRSPASPYSTDAPLLEIRDPYARGVRARFGAAPLRGRIGVI